MAAIKRPAMPFYVESWLSPGAARKMKPHDRGVYIDLIAYAWDKGGIPREEVDDDCSDLARTSNITKRGFREVWSRIRSCFVLTEDGRYISPKQETVRTRVELRAETKRISSGLAEDPHRKRQQSAEEKQGHSEESREVANQSGLPSVSGSISESGSKEHRVKPEEDRDRSASPSQPHPQESLFQGDSEFAATPPAKPKRAKPAKADREKPPLPFRADEALALLAEAGRFVASTMKKGHAVDVEKKIRAHPDRETWRLTGAWLAAGGDGWAAQAPDVRAIGNFEAWLAHARAWDASGRTPIARGAAIARIRGPAPVSKFEEDGDVTHRLAEML